MTWFNGEKQEYNIFKPDEDITQEDKPNYFLQEVKLGGYKFTKRQLMLFVAVNLCLVSLALNLILTPEILWFVPVCAVLLTAVLVIYAVSDKRGMLRNIRRSISVFCVALVLMQFFLSSSFWATDYVIPLLVIIFDIYLIVLLFAAKNKMMPVLISTIIISAHTIYPLVLFVLGYTDGSLAAKALIYTALILNIAIIINLTFLRLVSIKSKINKLK